MSIFALAVLMAARQESPPPIRREFRGVWVATVDNIDWPSSRDLPVAKQKRELINIFDTAAGMKLNAIILQIRPSADAIYPSKYEPWSEYLTGKQGRAPKPYYDPLKFAVEEAHKRGLELHAWFNPYRAKSPAQKGPVSRNHIAHTNPEVVKKYGPFLWMDPGEPVVQQRSLDVMMDVVKRYDVDGVHIDDYFYPYKEKGPDGQEMDFPDARSWNRYSRAGGRMTRGDWRRHNVDHFIETLYNSIKRAKPWVKFGISPFGIYRPGFPSGIKAGVDQYADLYADARKWLAEGWCDYFTPQLYWPIAQKAQSYPALLQWWSEQNEKGRHLWPGNFTGRTAPKEGNWKPKEIVDEIEATRSVTGATGNVHFSMNAFLRDSNGVADTLRGTTYSDPVLVPASLWLDSTPPDRPLLDISGGSFTWKDGGKEPAMWWAVWRRYGDRWIQAVFPRGSLHLDVDASLPAGPLNYFAVASVDRCGNMSELASWKP